MEAGATLEPGVYAAFLVEMDKKNACALAPIPLRLTVEHIVQGPAEKQGPVIKAHALVSNWTVYDFSTWLLLGLYSSHI